MSASDRQVSRRHTWILGGSVLSVFLLVGTWWFVWGAPAGDGIRDTRGGDSGPAAGRGGTSTGLLTTTTTATSRSATGPAASQAAKKWTPPRFKERQRDRDAMVAVIRDTYGLTDKAVLSAMAAAPRHAFVPEKLLDNAHDDTPLPIGYGQTISQPYIVAEMTRQLRLDANSRVLEIGTGSGYQAAVLTEFTPHVWTIEIVKALAEPAAERLKRLGYETIRAQTGDGYYGWPDAAQFDAIIVTCAAGQIPPPLIKQLAPGGRMVIPVGSPFSTQSLMFIEKDKDGTLRSRSLMAVRFVPLLHKDESGK